MIRTANWATRAGHADFEIIGDLVDILAFDSSQP
jgi:hypothetical protein